MNTDEKIKALYPFQYYTFSNISNIEKNGFSFDDYSFKLEHNNELYFGNINGLICRHDMGYPLRLLKYLEEEPDTMRKRKVTFLLPENYRECVKNLKGLRENVFELFDCPKLKDQITVITYKVDNSDVINKIEELKNMPKFDAIIANPPYGEPGTGDLQLHYTIISKLLDCYKNKMIAIMPHRIAYSTSEKYNNFKEKFTMVSEVTEIDSSCFHNTAMANIGIFVFENSKQEKININLKNRTYSVNNWFEVSPFTEYESTFINRLYNKNPNYNAFRPYKDDKDINKNGKNFLDNYCQKHFSNNNGYFVVTCLANGAGIGKGIFISSKDTQVIFDGIENLKKYFIEHNNFAKVISVFNTKNAANNYVAALKRPLLKFTLIKMQDDQNMTERCYQYIPDIDWNDDKTKTDFGILQLCGFTDAEAKEFSDYVMKNV